MQSHSSTPSELPPELQGWIEVCEVQNGAFFARELFRHKYLADMPDHGRHIVALYKDDAGAFHVLSYLHFWRQERIGLIGGGCTDGRVMRAMPDEKALAINAAGGLLRQTLLYAFTRFDTDIDAFFGHCGDDRAREVDLAAGFLPTEDEHLLIKPTRALSEQEYATLIAQALAIGLF